MPEALSSATTWATVSVFQPPSKQMPSTATGWPSSSVNLMDMMCCATSRRPAATYAGTADSGMPSG